MVDRGAAALFNKIYDSTNRKVLKFIILKCGNTSDISDIFQDTYIELYTVMIKRGIDYTRNYEALVMEIAKQKVFRYYTISDKLKSFLPMFSKNDEGEEINIADLQADGYSVEDDVSEKVLIEQVSKLISKEPDEVRKIFYLFYCMNMTIHEIASSLSLSESYVKNKIYRTIKKLRKLYSTE